MEMLAGSSKSGREVFQIDATFQLDLAAVNHFCAFRCWIGNLLHFERVFIVYRNLPYFTFIFAGHIRSTGHTAREGIANSFTIELRFRVHIKVH